MGKNIAMVARGIDVTPVLAELDALPELWNMYRMRTAFYGSPHNHISDIWVRYNAWANFDPENPAAFNDPHESVFYEAWGALPSLRELVFNVMRLVEGTRLGGILITRIPPGGRVEPHIDRGWHAGYYEKFAVSLKAGPGQAFNFEDGPFVTAPGDLFTFDNSQSHWVTNDSEEERVTLIICIRRE